MKKSRYFDFCALVVGALIALLYISPILQEVLHYGVRWPIYSAHSEGMSLSTYGRWWALPPHHYLTDAFSGDFPTFYNFMSDACINAISAWLNLPPMVTQAVFFGPLLGFLFFVLNYFSIKAVLRSPSSALAASLLISLGANSHLAKLLDPQYAPELNAILHVPFHALSLGNAQSLGWVFFIPTLALLFLARTSSTASRKAAFAISYGLCLGALFHIHTLTFINVIFIQTAYLTLTNALAPRTLPFRISPRYYLLLLLFFPLWSASGRPFTFVTLGVLVLCSMFLNFLIDRWRNFYFLTYVPALGLMLPYLLALSKSIQGVLGEQGQGNPRVAGLWGISLYFFVYLIGSLYALRRYRKDTHARELLHWCSAILGATFILGMNHHWGWSNHSYRFVIHLIFPLSILAAFGLIPAINTQKKAALPRLVTVTLCLLMLFNIFDFLRGRRPYANFVVGTESEAAFLQRIHTVTEQDQRLNTKLFTAPEFNYPDGMVQAAKILNYSQIPAFLPDYRYQLQKERYLNRLALFCYLFPKFPHFEVHTRLRACQEDLAPPQKLQIKTPQLNLALLPAYGIHSMAALGNPFTAHLLQSKNEWNITQNVLEEPDKLFFTLPEHSIEGVAKIGFGQSKEGTYSIPFHFATNSPATVVIAGRNLSKKALRLVLDDQTVSPQALSENWAILRLPQLNQGDHKLTFSEDSDFLYFLTILTDSAFKQNFKFQAE